MMIAPPATPASPMADCQLRKAARRRPPARRGWTEGAAEVLLDMTASSRVSLVLAVPHLH
jgi:hypothetical protein